MKRRLNILSVLVILILGILVMRNMYYVGIGAEAGSRMAMNNEGANFVLNMRNISVIPDEFLPMPDSVYNVKSASYVPATFYTMSAVVPVQKNVWSMFLVKTLPFAQLIGCILALVMFVKIIISINREDVFVWKNVYRLRWMGAGLILDFLGGMLMNIINSIELSGAFAMKGYSLNMWEESATLSLILGMAALIIGEVFAIGLRLKEEQDLTI